MGSAIKTIAISVVAVWLMMMVGCSFLATAVNHRRDHSASNGTGLSAGAARQRALEAARSEHRDTAKMVETSDDRLARALIAEHEYRARFEEHRAPVSYTRFSPGEPMVDPSVDQED